MTHQNSAAQTSVVILGGGLVGGLLAIFLKQNNIPFVLVESDSIQNLLDSVQDGRTTAVSLKSQHIFKSLNLWKNDLLKNACPINTIQVFEKGSFCNLQFDHDSVSQEPMGFIVENFYLRQAILDELKDHPHCYFKTTAKDIQKKQAHVHVELSNGMVLNSKLLVSAEGRKSPSRDLLAPQIKSRDYAQKALVVHLEHQMAHNFRAFEVFTPDGPFAILPLLDETLKKSGIVFAKPANFNWDKETNLMIEEEIESIFPFYGKVKIISKRWEFPLSVFTVDRLIGDRQVLIGDAAHGMHPLAGQGVNLGWRDVEALGVLIKEQYKLGIDIGSSSFLKTYQKKRTIDIQSLLKTTDFINQIFENNSKTLYYVRNLGLSLVNQIKPLKSFLIKKAMGF
ncbi:MAG: Ubiquinone hydroxylase UbiL [Holosporales bacterium]